MRVFFALFVLSFGLLQSFATAEPTRGLLPEPPKDIWHQVTHLSPFFTRDTADLRMVAVIQSDGHFARIIFGGPDQGAYVTVNLPGREPVTSLRSDLVFANGGVMTRMISGEALDAQVMTASDSVTYSFSIAKDDIRGFRSALTWTLTQDADRATPITLKGSSKAIRRALNDPRPLPAPLTLRNDATHDPRRAFFKTPRTVGQ